MKEASVVFWWADNWREGVIEQNDIFDCGYCIIFKSEPCRVALDYVTQWYYENDPSNIFRGERYQL